ncbi:MAG: hypothetical protein QNJ46_06620 [Leptolyngbyaceae cyanobacterium MO_188.B28]|nr:hypothetical protein [Leptolyngbyaceae cyanobacterium MO_188.B28]
MLRLVIRTTAILLSIGAVLVIVGLFDTFLGWDIFSQRVEDFLYGVFFSCLVLASVGIALSFVLGLLEIVEIMRASHEGRSLPPPRVGYYAKRSLLGVSALIGLLIALSMVNAGVQQHRQAVFRQLAEQQAQRFAPKIARSLPTNLNAPEVSLELEQAINTVRRLDLIRAVLLYLPDASDKDALWYYDGWPRNEDNNQEFERIFVSKRLEEAVSAALYGKENALQEFINDKKFVWLEPIQQGDVSAVLYLRGNETADFRDYSFSE